MCFPGEIRAFFWGGGGFSVEKHALSGAVKVFFFIFFLILHFFFFCDNVHGSF